MLFCILKMNINVQIAAMIEKSRRIVFKNNMHGIIEMDLFVKSEST